MKCWFHSLSEKANLRKKWDTILSSKCQKVTGSENSGRSDRLTHLPTEQFQPMMLLLTHEWLCTLQPRSNVEAWMRTPSATSTSGPITTLGPIRQFGLTFAVGCYAMQKMRRKWIRERKQCEQGWFVTSQPSCNCDHHHHYHHYRVQVFG